MPPEIDLHAFDDLVSAERLRRKLERRCVGPRKQKIDVAKLRKLTQGQAPLPYGIIEKMREDDRS
jgi:hypothetical protein